MRAPSLFSYSDSILLPFTDEAFNVMERVGNFSFVNSVHRKGGCVGVFFTAWYLLYLCLCRRYLLYWCLCRIPSFCPSRPALHPYPSSCVAQDTHLFGLHQWTPLPSGFMWSLVNRESGEKPGRREESEVGFVITWLPSYWVLLGCQHPSTKAFLSSSPLLSSDFGNNSLPLCFWV